VTADHDQDPSQTGPVEPDRYRAPALDKGLDILELLAEQAHGLTRAEIVKAMGRGPSEIYRMLERLVARHYVVRSAQGDRYALGMKLFVLAHRHPPVDRLVAHARPEMEAFAKAAQQSCHLGIYERGHVLVVSQVSSPGQWGLSIRLGARVGLLDTGSGQVLRAFQPAARVEEMLAELAAVTGQDHGLKTPEKPLIADTRARGYWQGPSQQAVGVEDISVPILDAQGHASAVLTCPFVRSPTHQTSSQASPQTSPDIEATRALLQRTATRLSMA